MVAGMLLATPLLAIDGIASSAFAYDVRSISISDSDGGLLMTMGAGVGLGGWLICALFEVSGVPLYLVQSILPVTGFFCLRN